MNNPARQDDRSRELDRILARLTENQLPAADKQRLAALVEGNPELRQRYLEYCQMHAMLCYENGLLMSLSEPSSQALTQERPHRRHLTVLAIAAVLLLACWPLVVRFTNRTPVPERGADVAVISRAVGAKFQYGIAGETTSNIGTQVPAGAYRLLRGIVELAYTSGVKMTIEAPASLLLVDQKNVELFEGKLSAHVPKNGIGFTVHTPRAAVVDLGTDFGVDVMNQDAEVHVFDGEVRVELQSEAGPNPPPLKLVTGQATRINRLTGLPAGINLDRQRFLGGLQSATHLPYVQQVLKLQPAVYYPMEPTSDETLVQDISGSDATAFVFPGKASRPIWMAGIFGTALDFGGPAQGTFAAAKWYPQTENGQLSVVAWVYARSRPRWASIVKNWAGGDDNRGQFHFGLYQDDGDLEVHVQDDSGEEIVVRENVALPLDHWHLVAFVADGARLRLFRNGQQVAEQPYQGLYSNPRVTALGIGTKLNLRGDAPEEQDFNMWDGRIDELAIFNRALSNTEIHTLFEMAKRAN